MNVSTGASLASRRARRTRRHDPHRPTGIAERHASPSAACRATSRTRSSRTIRSGVSRRCCGAASDRMGQRQRALSADQLPGRGDCEQASAPNVIPGELRARFNFRYSTEWTHERLRKAGRKRVRREHDIDYELNWHLSGEPFLTEPGALIDAVRQAVREVTGDAPSCRPVAVHRTDDSSRRRRRRRRTRPGQRLHPQGRRARTSSDVAAAGRDLSGRHDRLNAAAHARNPRKLEAGRAGYSRRRRPSPKADQNPRRHRQAENCQSTLRIRPNL